MSPKGQPSQIGPKSQMDPKGQIGPKSQIRTNPIEESGKAPHVRRLFLGKEHNRSLKSQKSLILTLSMLCLRSFK